MKTFLSHLKGLFKTRLGWMLVAANLLLAVWGASEKGWDLNGFHATYEPIAILISFVLNIPAMIIADLIDAALYTREAKTHASMIHIENSFILLTALCSVFQWLVIGYILESVIRKKLK
jgi:hypothetical protein